MQEPVHHQSAADPIRQKIEEFNNLERRILGSKLATGTPAGFRTQLEQRQARVDLATAKGRVAIAGMLVNTARQIDFHNCPLDTVALRGALLGILDKASDPDAVAAYRRRDVEFQAAKRRKVGGVRTFVAAARPSAELVAAAKALTLRHDALAGGFTGRAPLDALVALGRDFACTVRIEVEREQLDLVNGGIVDETVLELVTISSSEACDGKAATAEAAYVGTAGGAPALHRPLAATTRLPVGGFRRHTIVPHPAGVASPGYGNAHTKDQEDKND